MTSSVMQSFFKVRYTRGSLLLKHAPETCSRVSTPTSTHEGREGAEWWNHPIRAWELTTELAPETDSQQLCPWSLLPHIKPVWCEEVKLGSKSFVAQHIFLLKIVGADEKALLRERVTGACCGSNLPCVYRPLHYYWKVTVACPIKS